MNEDHQPTIIKIAAVVTATPRWVAALMAAEGLAVPAAWMWWWVPGTALFSAGMAIVEGLAFAYVFSAWRNQKDKQAERLLWLTIISAVIFVAVLAPYIMASVAHVTLAEILSNRFLLLLWAAAVAASTISIVVSVGYAQRAGKTSETNTELVEAKRKLADAEKARQAAEQRAAEAEQRFQAAGDLFVMLRAAEKRERILFARKTWPQLQPGAIAIITEASPSYVSDVLKETESV